MCRTFLYDYLFKQVIMIIGVARIIGLCLDYQANIDYDDVLMVNLMVNLMSTTENNSNYDSENSCNTESDEDNSTIRIVVFTLTPPIENSHTMTSRSRISRAALKEYYKKNGLIIKLITEVV